MKFVIYNKSTLKVMQSCLEKDAYHVYEGKRGKTARACRVDIISKGHDVSLHECSVLPLLPDGGVSVLTRRHASGIMAMLEGQTKKEYAEDIAKALNLSTKTVLDWSKSVPARLLSSYTMKEVNTWYS